MSDSITSTSSGAWKLIGRFLLALLLLLFLGALLLPAIPPNRGYSSTHHFCTHCGVRKHALEEWQGSIDHQTTQSELQPTPLSQWYEAHYPEPCQHEWCYNHSVTRGYFQIASLRLNAGTGSAGSHVTPFLISLSIADRDNLDSRFGADPNACKEYIALQLK